MELAARSPLPHPDQFISRHVGPNTTEQAHMLQALGLTSMEELIGQTVPAEIRTPDTLALPEALTEPQLMAHLQELADQNTVARNFLGKGYYGTHVPGVIRRNVLENPGWYTQYTPYQPEIAQGRLEALLNYQTLVADLTGLPVANASLLDEATAAAEAMTLAYHVTRETGLNETLWVADDVHPQTLALLHTRAEPLGIHIAVGSAYDEQAGQEGFALVVQYPATDGRVADYRSLAQRAHARGAVVIAATDLLALTLITPPGEWGADIAVGSAQRLGVPMGYGGPHAAFFAVKDDFKRLMPGRLVGLSIDSHGQPALRLALQTREQHIRREKATSNICTAQVLLAVMSSMYAVYHGPAGLRAIAQRTHRMALLLANSLQALGLKLHHSQFFDTLRVSFSTDAPARTAALRQAATAAHTNLWYYDDHSVGLSVDETTELADVEHLVGLFRRALGVSNGVEVSALVGALAPHDLAHFWRTSSYLAHPVFNSYHTETEMLRYIRRLESKDLSLCHSMIPLGSCTMKLNATAEMTAVTWGAFGNLHPFAPAEQAAGYHEMFRRLERYLQQVTGFPAVSLQPNSGAQGEYAGLLVIREYLKSLGQGHRTVALIPHSAHGTNPASAVMAGMQVVVVKTDEQGDIDMADLQARCQQYADRLAVLMITYPSTHGVFEARIREMCDLVHQHGGQVYMDGANMNAQVGLTSPGAIGADVCHLNLHKTFCIPHGGGGPGMGPIGVAAHLAPFLPGHPVVPQPGRTTLGPVSAAPWGSSSILIISYAYICMMGSQGLTEATEVAILNANYLAQRLGAAYPVLYTGPTGRVAHELILDLRPLRKHGIEAEDLAKRLIDYGYHAPTLSWPVAFTLMIEPTESESLAELDRFAEAMLAIHKEITEVVEGRLKVEDSPLRHAPHTAAHLAEDHWPHAYSRRTAAYPAPWLNEFKFWPTVGRVNNTHGDRHLVCTCPSIESYAQPETAELAQAVSA